MVWEIQLLFFFLKNHLFYLHLTFLKCWNSFLIEHEAFLSFFSCDVYMTKGGKIRPLLINRMNTFPSPGKLKTIWRREANWISCDMNWVDFSCVRFKVDQLGSLTDKVMEPGVTILHSNWIIPFQLEPPALNIGTASRHPQGEHRWRMSLVSKGPPKDISAQSLSWGYSGHLLPQQILECSGGLLFGSFFLFSLYVSDVFGETPPKTALRFTH